MLSPKTRKNAKVKTFQRPLNLGHWKKAPKGQKRLEERQNGVHSER